MTNTRRLELLREYAILSAQVLELQRQMAVIEAKFTDREPAPVDTRKGRFSKETKIGRLRAWIEQQKNEFTISEAVTSVGVDRKSAHNLLYNMKLAGRVKRLGHGHYKLAA